ncbi:unnamed protein product, partial [Agarophyton chilense]
MDLCADVNMSATPFDGHVREGFEAIATYKQGVHIPHGSPHGPLGANGIVAFRHKKSQVRIVLFAAPGPLVSGKIVVGTRPISNAGHPHTLEHIVFLGSHKHPQRGYLDHLACRCIGNGTNAWTDTDHTAYTCETAGFEGFSTLLPCFVDHILRPTMEDASFASEVYHVRPDGTEAGVVFCEMQAREHTESDITDRELRGLLLGGTPLAFESGGLCDDIRQLSNEEIVRFHRDQYCGANVTIVVGGSGIAPNDLLDCIKAELDEVCSCAGFDAGEPQWRRAVQLEALPSRTRKVVPFPCADTEVGTVVFGWRGVGAAHKLTNMAVGVLLHYLVNDVWSPMRQRFVETEQQVAGDITYSQEVFRDASVIEISLEGVQHLRRDGEDGSDDNAADDGDSDDGDSDDGDSDADDADDDDEGDESEMSDGEGEESLLTSGKVEDMVVGFLQDVVRCGQLPGGLGCVHAAMKNEKESYLAELESDCHEVVGNDVIEEIVYGEASGARIGQAVRGSLEMYDTLGVKDEAFWVDLLRRVLVEAPRVEVVMVPDCALADAIAREEQSATERRASRGVAEKGGKEVGAHVVPGGWVDGWAVGRTGRSASEGRLRYSVWERETEFCLAQSVEVESSVVQCTVVLDASDLPLEQRVLLPVVRELLLESDVRLCEGGRMGYAESARRVGEATITTGSCGAFVGVGDGAWEDCVGVTYVATEEGFDEATRLVLQSVFGAEVSAERVAAVSQSVLAGATADMRDEGEVLQAAVRALPYVTEVGEDDDDDDDDDDGGG